LFESLLTPDGIQALVSLGWLALAVVVCLLAAPLLHRVIRERSFSVEIAGIKLSAQDATENMTTAIKDLQESVRKLEARAAPVADGSVLRSEAPATVESEPDYKGKSILWVDDYPENNALVVEKLREDGFSIDTALSTREGMKLFKRRRFDLVLSDMGRKENGREVPDAGVQLIQELRGTGTEVPIIVFCSTRANDHFGNRARNAGANHVTSSAIDLYGHINSVFA